MTATYAPALPRRSRNVDRPAGHAVYGLYLFSPFLLGIPAVVGLAIAYARRKEAADVDRRHFEHQIETAWSSLAWLLAAAIWAGAAIVAGETDVDPQMFDLFGKPAMLSFFAAAALAMAPLQFLGRTLVGWAKLASGEPVGHSRRR